MSDSRQPQSDPLEEAVKAFRQAAIPDKPLDASVLLRLANAQREIVPVVPIPSLAKRRFLMRFVVPSTAALVLLGTAAVFVLTTSPSPTLADVVEATVKHKLVKYTQEQTTDSKDLGAAITVSVVYADLKTARFRSESRHQFQDPDDAAKNIEEVSVSISDAANDRHLMTNTHPGGKVLPSRKDAWLGRDGTSKNAKSFLDNLQEFERKKGVTQVKDKLGEIETIKYRFEEGNETVSLWVDAKSKLPIRMEQEWTDPNADTTHNKFVLTDFQWDPELPKGFKNLDALFDTTPPKDYTLTDETKKNEK